MRRFILGLATLYFSANMAWGQSDACEGDVNGDMIVDLDDLLTLLIHYGQTCDSHVDSATIVYISEIHYNPNSAQGNDSDWEFLELYNPNPTAIQLGGWSIGNAVQCSFQSTDTIPPFGFFVAARNLDSLSTVLPEVNYARQWNSGESLNNTGETIEVIAPDGTVVSAVAYEDNDGWVPEPDGTGPSLEWMDPNLNNAAADSWTFSLVFGGTPGWANSMWGLSDLE